jgi:hypothetical protein
MTTLRQSQWSPGCRGKSAHRRWLQQFGDGGRTIRLPILYRDHRSKFAHSGPRHRNPLLDGRVLIAGGGPGAYSPKC